MKTAIAGPSPDPTIGNGPGGSRTPLTRVRLLLPVWGYKYIRYFLEVGIKTWLSEGNIPAVAAALPTEFVFLTSREDEPYLTTHASFKKLSAICKTEVHYIDHLITGTNYSTTITLAYTEAVRAVGPRVVDTCFFFLVSDYIVADGSFRNALKRIENGASGVLVGNFQLVEEDALPWIEDEISRSRDVLTLSSRELMRWGLSHLHPATVANIVNLGFSHNNHTNRLFWLADNSTLIGRFYLMHMICIRPELDDFIIGSSCDYSFIPEMCPSDNVEIIADSDEYLVLELQPRFHESHFLRTGQLSPKALARTLEEWTTMRHRKNSDTLVLFHAGDPPEALPKAMAEFETFVAKVHTAIHSSPRPHRTHPYWTGALASQKDSMGIKLDAQEWRIALGLPNPDLEGNPLLAWRAEILRFALFGTPPHVTRLHPRWRDYQLILDALRKYATDDSRLLLLSNTPTAISTGLADGGERTVRFRSAEILRRSAESLEPLSQKFDLCLIECSALELPEIDALLDRTAPMVKPGGKILLSIANNFAAERGQDFGDLLARNASLLVRPYARSTRSSFNVASYLNWRGLNWQVRLARLFKTKPAQALFETIITAPFLLLANLYWSLFARNASLTLHAGQIVSSALIEIEVDGRGAREAYTYSRDRLLRARIRRHRGLGDAKVAVDEAAGLPYDLKGLLGGPETFDATVNIEQKDLTVVQETEMATKEGGTREPQYNRCLDIKQKQGLTSLGLMTNQVWEDDPRRLTFLLSRYKFVSKMLTGKKLVGELGCGDAFGTRIVMQEAEKVIAYDFDPTFISDIKERYSERWPVEAHYHDILDSPLPNTHDGIYSLDVIEHIPSSDEDKYVKNLRDSLTPDGVLIIGSPSLESQPYASPPSKAGHINCKSGNALRALLKNYFDNVFLFSMNDEVVHTGYAPMAHYLFAVCCQKKSEKLGVPLSKTSC